MALYNNDLRTNCRAGNPLNLRLFRVATKPLYRYIPRVGTYTRCVGAGRLATVGGAGCVSAADSRPTI